MTARPLIRPRPGAALRTRREDLGLSRSDVASATRIPLEHLVAIEEDRFDDVPAGPYAAAYVAALEEHLDTTVETPPPPAAVDRGVPLRFVRWIAAFSVVAMAAAIAWQVAENRGTSLASGPTEPAAPVRDLQVVLTTRRTVELAVRLDGEPAVHRVVPGGEVLTFDAFDRIEIDVPAVDAVRFEHDGRTIVPQGRQDHPRTVVFVDDAGQGA